MNPSYKSQSRNDRLFCSDSPSLLIASQLTACLISRPAIHRLLSLLFLAGLVVAGGIFLVQYIDDGGEPGSSDSAGDRLPRGLTLSRLLPRQSLEHGFLRAYTRCFGLLHFEVVTRGGDALSDIKPLSAGVRIATPGTLSLNLVPSETRHDSSGLGIVKSQTRTDALGLELLTSGIPSGRQWIADNGEVEDDEEQGSTEGEERGRRGGAGGGRGVGEVSEEESEIASPVATATATRGLGVDFPESQSHLRQLHESLLSITQDTVFLRQDHMSRADSVHTSIASGSGGGDQRVMRSTASIRLLASSSGLFWLDAFRDWLLRIQAAFDFDRRLGRITEAGECRPEASMDAIIGLHLIVQANPGVEMSRVCGTNIFI
ncbi:unnamed protein product [Protopolystoma xenopodis]|uniref:Uncharacterized protein n=1 Tax=Protopolystoma xenopodis TaxID=117903 RepID=A0A448XHA7_9PLAT|nr:unnamed protein product [Protopolystoma xenopodis]